MANEPSSPVQTEGSKAPMTMGERQALQTFLSLPSAAGNRVEAVELASGGTDHGARALLGLTTFLAQDNGPLLKGLAPSPSLPVSRPAPGAPRAES
jgi:hypothetical protein